MRTDFVLEDFEFEFESFLSETGSNDASHDLLHVRRVVSTAKMIGRQEGACPDIYVPAAWLHDCVEVSKNSSDRCRASRMAASKARELLGNMGYPPEHIPNISHAIEAHSYSAKIEAKTIEAKVVQDADRLDAIGAIGIGRCFLYGGVWPRPIYDEEDPFCDEREPEENRYVLDHLFVKPMTIHKTMQTKAGREEAIRRTCFLESFVEQLKTELRFGS